MTASSPQTNSAAGFTLVETLCALLITAVVTLAIVTLYRSHQDAYAVNSRRMALQADLRRAMAVITSEVRSAGFDPSEMAGAGIVVAASDYLYFTRDLDGDGHMDQGTPGDSGEHVAFCRYRSNGKYALGRHSGGINGGSCGSGGSGGGAADCPGPVDNYHNPVAAEISELSFHYHTLLANGDWQEIPASPDKVVDAKSIHRIDISLGGSFHYKGRDIRRQLTESVLLRSNLY